VAELDRLGFQVHFHGLGDRAVREALDAVDAASPPTASSATCTILPTFRWCTPRTWRVSRPWAPPRTFSRCGPATNRRWTSSLSRYWDLSGAGWQYPFRSLLAAGAELAAGSDWPVTSPDPIHGMHVAVTRSAPGGQAEPLIPAERLTLAEALTAYTAGTAR
jgi:predicted amidohydrolase YtcJ